MKKMLFDFIVKKYVELITYTLLLKRMYLLNFEKFFYWKSRNYSQHFSLVFLRSIYLKLLTIGVVFLHYT